MADNKKFPLTDEERFTDPFAEYLTSSEPSKAIKTYAWQIAIGLQDVDKLQPSEYLINTAKDNIEGSISIEEARQRIESYYEENKTHQPERTEEADKVSVRIAEILSENSFVFSINKQPIKQPIEKPSLSEILETKAISSRTKANICRLYDIFGSEKVFGRSDVLEALAITERPATLLISRLYELGLTERITGAGKGKYRFII